MVDALVIDTWQGAHPPEDLGLWAVGGYGCGRLFPYSDIDLLILHPHREPTEEERAFVSSFIQQLWDRKLRVSQSVRDADYCGRFHEDNVELTTSLLDRRWLTGSDARRQELDVALGKLWVAEGKRLRETMVERTRGRHRRFEHTFQHLEPDVKEGPGGLRDAGTIEWLSALGCPAKAPADAVDFVSAVRWALHQTVQRDMNVLRFEWQPPLFAEFTSPEEGMREYYRCARAIYQQLLRQLERSEAAPGNLLTEWQARQSRLSTPEFLVSKQRVLLRQPSSLDWPAIQRLFAFVARHGIALGADAVDRLLSWQGPVQMPEASEWQSFLQEKYAGFALRCMAETGFLSPVLPAWEHVDCLVVPDLHHRFTVDEHTLRTIETVDRLTLTDASEDARFVSIAEELERPDLLRAALLLHDLAKGTGHEHTSAGELVAREATAAWGFSDAETSVVASLVLHHLLLSQLMSKRDVTDIDSLRPAADALGTVEQLKLLTVMTYCDIGAVNATALSPWRRDQLWRTYVGLSRLLMRNVDDERLPPDSGFAAGFPARYRWTHSPEEIIADEVLIAEAKARGCAARIEPQPSGFRVTVASPDRPHLFADLAGAIASQSLEIVRGEAFTSSEQMALDRFLLLDPMRTLELNPTELRELQLLLQDTAAGRTDVKRLLARRPLPKPSHYKTIQPLVDVANHTEHSTVIEVVATDRAGLLYDLTSVLTSAGCDLNVVLIDTEAHRALDTFYVTKGGRPLGEDEAKEVKALLLRVLL